MSCSFVQLFIKAYFFNGTHRSWLELLLLYCPALAEISAHNCHNDSIPFTSNPWSNLVSSTVLLVHSRDLGLWRSLEYICDDHQFASDAYHISPLRSLLTLPWKASSVCLGTWKENKERKRKERKRSPESEKMKKNNEQVEDDEGAE